MTLFDHPRGSAQQFVIISMVTDPEPKNPAGNLGAERAMIQADTNGPKTTDFLEM